MKVWILFSFLALVLAEEDKDRLENINDIGVPYDVNGQEYLPIFPFDAFNIGYKNFFNRLPPWASAINKEETEKESIDYPVSDKEELPGTLDSLLSEVKEEELSEDLDYTVSEVELIDNPEFRSSSESISYSKSKDSAGISVPEVSESESSISYSVSSNSESSFSSSASSASFSSPSMSVSYSASDKSSSMSVRASASSEYEVQIPPPTSSQTVEKYPSMEIDREASKTENQKLKVDDVRKSLEKSYKNLGELKKKLLFKKQDVVGDLSEVIHDLELLCDRICQTVPERYLLSTPRIMF